MSKVVAINPQGEMDAGPTAPQRGPEKPAGKRDGAWKMALLQGAQ
jgi:hypothetical protein